MLYRKFKSTTMVAFIPADDTKKIEELCALGWYEPDRAMPCPDCGNVTVYDDDFCADCKPNYQQKEPK